ncbi:MAG: ABC transporter permease [Pseudomonadota bacterium]
MSHWRRHPGQAITLLLGLALATALWSGVQAINAEARASYDRAAATLGQDQLSRLDTASGAPVPVDTFIALRRAGYLVSPVLSGVIRDGSDRLRLLGIDPLTAPAEAQPPAITDPEATGVGVTDMFSATGVLMMDADTARGPLPGDLPPLALSDTVPPGAAITDIATAARLLGQDAPSYLLVAPDQPMGLPPIAEASDLHLVGPQSASDITQLTDSFHLNLTAFGLLSFAVGLFIVHGAVGLAFEQRRPMARTLRALGTPLRVVLTAFGLEMAVLALIAGGIGLILGYVMAAALMPGVSGTLRGLYGAEMSGTLTFEPLWALSALGMTLLGAGVAAAQSLWQMARLPILAPAQPRSWAQASGRMMRLQAFGGLLCIIAAITLAVFGSGLLTGFGILAGLLLAAALLLPAGLTGALRLISRRASTVTTEWVLADTRQQLPGLSLALMALLLALAANIGVSTMVGSFRSTFLGWLDQRLASELYVTVADPAEADAILAYLTPRVDAILPIMSTEQALAGRPAQIFGVVDHATYRDNWPLLDSTSNAWDRIASGSGVLINEQMARRNNLGPGDVLEVRADLPLDIVGVYSDYGNPNGQAILGQTLFQQLFPDVTPRQFALRLPPEEVAALAASLREDLGLPTDAVVNQDQIKAFSISVFEQTFRITGALNILTLGVAGVALLTSLLTLANMRLPQLAPVWAMGMTRAHLARLEVLRSLILAALTCVLALPVGLILAWVLLAVVNVEAFGWRLPMQLFPLDWARLFAISLLTALIAAAIPARKLAKLPPITLLKVFSHDR